MATFYADSKWGWPFNGTESEPYNAIAGGTNGVRIGNQPAAGAMVIRNNAFFGNASGIRDSSNAFVLGNSWSGNTVDNDFGTIASKDPGAVPAGQAFSLNPPVRQVGANRRAALEAV